MDGGISAYRVAEVQPGGDASAPDVDAALQEVRGGEEPRSRVWSDVVAHHHDRTAARRGR